MLFEKHAMTNLRTRVLIRKGLGFRVQGLGFRVAAIFGVLGFHAQGLEGSASWASGFRIRAGSAQLQGRAFASLLFCSSRCSPPLHTTFRGETFALCLKVGSSWDRRSLVGRLPVWGVGLAVSQDPKHQGLGTTLSTSRNSHRSIANRT